MRTVLIGSDFMYDKDGNLKPIEINTAVGWDGIEKLEEDADCLDLSNLYQFVTDNNFETIHYLGDIEFFHKTLESHYSGSSITYEFHPVGKHSITIPYIEDNDTTLIIRSAYDTTAIIDDTYCRDKVEFMKLIQSQSFSSQFAYVDNEGNLINNITTITDNDIHPNFILKSVTPQYDSKVYPKFFKVSNQTELDIVISENVTADYFLMENYVNEEKVWNGHVKVIRSLNLLYPPTLESIQLGQYTKINQNMLLTNVTYDSSTFEIDYYFRDSYLTTTSNERWLPKLLDTDLIEMEDGSFKTVLELEVGDIIKTINIPNPNGVDNSSYLTDFNINYNTLVNGTTYSTNTVTFKRQVNRLSIINDLVFEDGSTWEDTGNSHYLIDRNNNIQFISLFNILPGDVVLLLDTTDSNVNFIRKTVQSNTENKRVFSGWTISVENAHLFLTKISSTNNESYITIEHNGPSCPVGACISCYSCASCPKAEPYCWEISYCYSSLPGTCP